MKRTTVDPPPGPDARIAEARRAASCGSCPLCLRGGALEPLRGADERRYFHCDACALIFADPRHRLPRTQEEAHYRTHENGIGNAGYVAFLRRVVDPALPFLIPGMRGLDYGCGPGPTLSRIVRHHGLDCEDYDPLFADVPLNPPYDFLFATECFEHFHSPGAEIGRIARLLRPGGLLGVMTELWTGKDAFRTWYYTRDPTHVSFYHARTFEFIGREHGFEPLATDGRRVHLFKRSPA